MTTYVNTEPVRRADEWVAAEARGAKSVTVQLNTNGAGNVVLSDTALGTSVAAANAAMTDALVFAHFLARQVLVKSPIAVTIRAYSGGTYNTTGPSYTGGVCRGIWALAAGEAITLPVICDCLKLTTVADSVSPIQILFTEAR